MSNTGSKKEVQIIKCDACNSTGKQGIKRCENCGGIGIAGWTGSELLYWGKIISYAKIAEDRLFYLVNKTINGVLYLFGVIGISLLGYSLLKNWQLTGVNIAYLNKPSLILLVFYVSILTDTYLIYRFNRELEKIRFIPKKKYDDDSRDVINTINWEVIKKISRKKKIDIAEYFNTDAEKSVAESWKIANKYHDAVVTPIHLFVALLGNSQTQIIFSRLGISFTTLKNKIRNTLAQQLELTDSQAIIGENLWAIIFSSYLLAYEKRQKKVDVIELLEQMASQENEVTTLLYDLDVTKNKIVNVISWLRIRKQLRENWLKFRQRASLRPKSSMNRAMTAVASPVLDVFGHDITYLAQSGYLFPCIGRDDEIETIFQNIKGGSRKSTLLIGNPGVGRNTIIEGVAQKMVAEAVPKFLADKRLVSLSVAKLVSGASPSEAQQRLMLITNEIRRAGNIILYISDIHNMIGITSGRQGSIDLADVLSQSLKNIVCFATTTPSDYSRYIENKSSIDSVFSKLNIDEVTGDEAIQILEAKAGTVEYQQKVFFSYDAISKIVDLSDRYLHDRYLPEKAIEILQEVSTKIRDSKGKNSTITGNDVAIIISDKTKIPLADITQEESEKLLNLETKIHERMVDQQEAVSMVASSLRRARAEMRDISRPIVNLLFLGPTGVGKTELAKTVAEVYFGAAENMIRLDMSEYQEKNSVNRLIGSPTGYSDSSGGGFLSDAVRKNPFSLILLDEIEKAHPDILNIFLQVMDDGRLTDNSGKTIDFTNTIIIATSNAGTQYIQDRIAAGDSVENIKNSLVDSQLGQYFRPELLNRFDGIIVFKPLSMADVVAIAKLMINKVAKNLETKGIALDVSQVALEKLASEGFDINFGARPLRRVIQQKLQDPIANLILASQATRRDTIVYDENQNLSLKKARPI
ncbi:MAG: ATP-dependent Clp protease ATP-binding subunit [Patescibacteria group bacterium]|nr:ATP-dependent Clp protease ATP-binding subunit [Patescibacteria group bacterium]